MNADMQAYASAVKNTTANEGETVGAATFTSLFLTLNSFIPSLLKFKYRNGAQRESKPEMTRNIW